MRIAIIGPAYPFRGGIAHHTTLLAEALSARHEVAFIGFTRQDPRFLIGGRSDRDPSGSPRPGPAERILDPLDPRSWRRTAARIRAFRPDLIVVPWWVPWWAPSLTAVVGLARRGAAGKVPNVLFLCHNVLPHDRAGPVSRALIRMALGHADAYMVHSAPDLAALRRLMARHLARLERDGGPRAYLGFLPLFDLGSIVPRGEARAALGLPLEAPMALFFGIVRPYKGLADLLAAWPAVVAAVPTARLMVAGDFWESAAGYRAQAEALGITDSVTFREGYVPDEALGAIFGAADALVLPYRTATQSAVALLGLHHGLPLIATSVGGLPEVVRDGESGLLVPPGDSSALAGAIVQVLGDDALHARLAAGARHDRSRFSWEALVVVIEEIAARLGLPDHSLA